MHHSRLAFLGFASLLLAACQRQVTLIPDAPQMVQSFSSAAAPQPNVMERLMSLQLPGGWGRTERGESVVFGLPSMAYNSETSERDYFIVKPLGDDVCDKAYADEQVRMNWGDKAPARYRAAPFADEGRDIGYMWAAFDGVRGDATEPGYVHWCVRRPRGAMDIDIAAVRTDGDTREFVEEIFVPRWLAD